MIMPLLTTLIFGIDPSVAKVLLKSVLKDHPLIGEIAPDLLDILRDKAKGERTQRDNSVIPFRGRLDILSSIDAWVASARQAP